MEDDTIFHIVNGEQLPNFVGKPVTLFAVVTKNGSPIPSSFIVNTCDNVSVTISVATPVLEDITGSSVVIRGLCESKQCIKANEYHIFKNNLDITAYNNLCQFINSIPDFYEYDPDLSKLREESNKRPIV